MLAKLKDWVYSTWFADDKAIHEYYVMECLRRSVEFHDFRMLVRPVGILLAQITAPGHSNMLTKDEMAKLKSCLEDLDKWHENRIMTGSIKMQKIASTSIKAEKIPVEKPKEPKVPYWRDGNHVR